MTNWWQPPDPLEEEIAELDFADDIDFASDDEWAELQADLWKERRREERE